MDDDELAAPLGNLKDSEENASDDETISLYSENKDMDDNESAAPLGNLKDNEENASDNETISLYSENKTWTTMKIEIWFLYFCNRKPNFTPTYADCSSGAAENQICLSYNLRKSSSAKGCRRALSHHQWFFNVQNQNAAATPPYSTQSHPSKHRSLLCSSPKYKDAHHQSGS
jgi:hypothetical protein